MILMILTMIMILMMMNSGSEGLVQDAIYENDPDDLGDDGVVTAPLL